MRTFIVLLGLMGSVSAFASTDAELCKQYGHDIASNSAKGQAHFLTEMNQRASQGTWTLDAKECNAQIAQGKWDYNSQIAEMFSSD
ncbi:hypothetical protein [Vibrio sp. SCSIO 43136]|uniref:hypothetical protein n=1 Tax=Vibrio sp. SCSIO 43136 TaxID=2819101 RepID=UPI002075C17A|nr:hypothetical protein [Vibrio sp. SCSIO 43136]USD64266.1 hypothetical protein J4N39_09100 [Vibrio sp. SCSIO 43136]